MNDLKVHNVIFVGSSDQNIAVEQFVPTGNFEFVDPDLSDPWSGRIVNTQPQPGEQSIYKIELDGASHTVRADYALISFQPGLIPGRHIALLAGIDTTGCAGAALFLNSAAGMKVISNTLSHARNGSRSPDDFAFQALLRVDVAEGNQVRDTRLVLLHPFN